MLTISQTIKVLRECEQPFASRKEIMKRHIAALASSLMLLGQITAPVGAFAEIYDESGVYWTASEVIPIGQFIDSTIDEICADGPISCRSTERMHFLNEYGYPYSMYWTMQDNSLKITSINPLRSTVRMYYSGRNATNQDIDRAKATELYAFWVEDWQQAPLSNYSNAMWDNYIDQIRAGNEIDGVHVVLNFTEPQTNDNEWLPSGEEQRFVLETGSLKNNWRRTLYATLYDETGRRSDTFIDYASCVSPDGRLIEGVECNSAYYYHSDAYDQVYITATENPVDTTLPSVQDDEREEPAEPEARTWSAKELLALADSIKEEQAACDDGDYICKQAIYYAHHDEDPEKFDLMERITEQNFLITSIDLTENTFRAVYRQYTPLMEMNGDISRSPEWVVAFWDMNLYDDIESNLWQATYQNPGANVVFDYNFAGSEFAANLSGRELSYPLSGFIPNDDLNHAIFYTTYYSSEYLYGDYYTLFADYSACVDADGNILDPDSECGLMINTNYHLYYAPMEKETDAVSFEQALWEEEFAWWESQMEPDPNPDEPDLDPNLDSNSEPEPEPESELNLNPEPEFNPDSGSEVEPDSEPELNPEPDPEIIPNPDPEEIVSEYEGPGNIPSPDQILTPEPSSDDSNPPDPEPIHDLEPIIQDFKPEPDFKLEQSTTYESVPTPTTTPDLDSELTSDESTRGPARESIFEPIIITPISVATDLDGFGGAQLNTKELASIVKNESPVANPSKDFPKAPDTGTATDESAKDDIALQWLLPLTISIVLYITWWLLPVNKKKKQ